jgi:hypothetical protein
MSPNSNIAAAAAGLSILVFLYCAVALAGLGMAWWLEVFFTTADAVWWLKATSVVMVTSFCSGIAASIMDQ